MTTHHKRYSVLLSLLLITGFAIAQTGNDKNEKQIRLKIVQSENGKTTTIDTVFSDETSLNAFMEKSHFDTPEPQEPPLPPDAPAPPDLPAPPHPPAPPAPFTEEKSREKMHIKKEMKKIEKEIEESLDDLKTIKLDIRIDDLNGKDGKCIIIKNLNGNADSLCCQIRIPDVEKLKEELKELDDLKSFHFDFNDDDNRKVKRKSKVIIIEKNGDDKIPAQKDNINPPIPDKPAEEKKSAPKEAAGFLLEPKTFAISPNPGNGQYKLKFTLPSAEPVSVKVLDLSGDVVFSDDILAFNGQYDKDLNITGHSGGSYLLQIRQGDLWMHKKIVLQ